MPLNNAGKSLAGNAIKTGATHVAIHTADPGTTGANPSSAARKPVTLTVDASGNVSCPSTAFTGGASSGPATHVGLWSALTGGTFYGGFALTGDTTFNTAGEYTLTSLTLTLSSTG